MHMQLHCVVPASGPTVRERGDRIELRWTFKHGHLVQFGRGRDQHRAMQLSALSPQRHHHSDSARVGTQDQRNTVHCAMPWIAAHSTLA